MHIRLLAVIILVCAPFCSGAEPAKPFVHPGMLQNRDDLDFMKAKVLAGEQPWKGAWDRMLHASYSSLDFKPKPFEHVIRGPYGRPSIGSNELIAGANAAESHAIQWYVTGDKAHAEKVIEILNAWSPVLKDFQQNDAKLLAGWTGHQFLNAAEIIRYTDAGWRENDIEQFKKMILGVYYPLIKDFFPEANGNWDAAIMDTMLCIGIFCDDHAIFDRAVDHYLRGHLNGGITHYVYPSGQCQESTRDMAHTQLGLGEMAQACRVAWTQGVDLFGAADNRLALGFEYTAKYLLGNDVPCENQISPVGRGKFSDIYYVVYDHYHFEKGLDMPFTAKAVEQTASRSHSVLTMYKGPRSKPVASRPAPKPEDYALEGGAMSEPTAKPDAGAIRVEPGQSIQEALNVAGKKGGWVVLGKGVHKLSESLNVPSGVTLAGEGAGTVLWLDPRSEGPAILIHDSPHDITFRDFVVEGATTVQLPSDPNSARRTRSRPGVLRRVGIGVFGTLERASRKIRFDHITVRNCTEVGIVITQAADVEFQSVSLTDNGSIDAQQPNLSLWDVAGCRISHSRFNNSPSSCGAALVSCSNVTVDSNEFARNLLEGLRVQWSHDFQVQGNLIEGNEADGIAVIGFARTPQHIELTRNLIQYNDDTAVRGGPYVGAKLHDNRDIGNKNPMPY